MRNGDIRRFLTIVIAVAITAHVAAACSVAAAIAIAYPHRILDITRWKGKSIEGLRFVASFLRERAARKDLPTVVFGGSSFTYGYPWPEQAISSRIFARARQDFAVVNASMLSGDVSSVNDWIVCGAKRAGVRLDVMVVEIPVVNTVSNLMAARRAGHLKSPRLAICDGSEDTPGILRFAMRHAMGLGWLPFLWDNEAYPKDDEVVKISAVPAGYFVSKSEFEVVRLEFESQISELLRNAMSVATVVYAYPAPVFVEGMREAGSDHEAMQQQLNYALAACEKVSGIRCLDPARRFGARDMYYNLTHLNQRGHRAMGEWLAREVAVK